MIDFANGSVFKLSPADPGQLGPEVAPLLVQGEGSNVAGFCNTLDAFDFAFDPRNALRFARRLRNAA